MSSGKHCEMERKYLIRYPDTAHLAAQPGCEVWEITQIYLEDGEDGLTRRVRRVRVNGEVKYFRTFKSRVSALSALEDEGEITAEDYAAYCAQQDPSRQPILKTRYRIPVGDFTAELDIFHGRHEGLLLVEVEFPSVDAADAFVPPTWFGQDVSEDPRYRNSYLAHNS